VCTTSVVTPQPRPVAPDFLSGHNDFRIRSARTFSPRRHMNFASTKTSTTMTGTYTRVGNHKRNSLAPSDYKRKIRKTRKIRERISSRYYTEAVVHLSAVSSRFSIAAAMCLHAKFYSTIRACFFRGLRARVSRPRGSRLIINAQ